MWKEFQTGTRLHRHEVNGREIKELVPTMSFINLNEVVGITEGEIEVMKDVQGNYEYVPSVDITFRNKTVSVMGNYAEIKQLVLKTPANSPYIKGAL